MYIHTDRQFYTVNIYIYIIEGSLEVKLPTIWTDEKQSREEERREEKKSRREKITKRKSKKKEDTDARKGRKVAKHCVFPMICGSGGSKSRLAKAAGAEPAGHRSDEKLHAVVARSTFPKSKCTKQLRVRTTFGSCDVEKVHAVVARSTFPSQNAQNTPGPDHFWKLRCRKSARRCGAKHMSKSKCTRHTMVRTTFGKLRCRKSARRCGAKHISKSKCRKHGWMSGCHFWRFRSDD